VKNKFSSFTVFPIILLAASVLSFIVKKQNDNDRFVTYQVNLKKNDLKFYWKDDKGQNFKSIQNLKSWVENQKKILIFAMNAGMYKEDNSPLGLYIENGKIVSPLNTLNGQGNFYLKPNGVLYIATNNTPVICQTRNFKNSSKIKYATQSGPMLLTEGKIHPAFKQGSTNLNIRNGVGILPNHDLVFAMSKKEVSFYDFAAYFQSLGCKDALYLDGFVSRMYLPGKQWVQTDGDFGVIIGVTKQIN